MRKKIGSYIGVVAILASFLLAPLDVIAETTATSSSSTYEKTTETTASTETTKTETTAQSEPQTIDKTSSAEEPAVTTTATVAPDQEKNQSILSAGSQLPPLAEPAPQPLLAARAVRSDIAVAITAASMTDGQGAPLNEAFQWTDIQMNLAFSLPNNALRAGDTTTVTLPDSLMFTKDQTFEVKSASGDVIANATIDQATKKVILTYTNFVESHADVSGSMHFTTRVDTTKVTESQDIPVALDVSGVPQNMGTVKYKKVGDSPDEKFMKYGSFADDEGKQVNYVLRVNAAGQNYTNTVVSDSLRSEGMTFDQSSFRILKGKWKMTSSGFFGLENEQDVTSQYPIQFSADNRSFTVNLGDLQGDGYRIDYKANTNHKPVNGESFKNNSQMMGNNAFVDARLVDLVYQSASGDANGYDYTITIHKKDDQGNNLAGAEFEIIRDSTNASVGKITTDSAGNGRIQKVLKDNYTIHETKAPTGYTLLSDTIKITTADFDTNKEVTKDVINKKEAPAKTTVSGQKTWDDGDDRDGKRPSSIKVNLLANGVLKDSHTVNVLNDWKYQFADLPKNDAHGQLIDYTVTENQVEDYNTEIKGYNITNRYTPGTTSVGVTKSWDDWYDQDGLRPASVQVQLYADGEASGSPVQLNNGNNWHTVWNDLPENKNDPGAIDTRNAASTRVEKIIYTVKEVGTLSGYTTSVNDSDLGNVIITNVHKPETTKVEGQKTWVDDSIPNPIERQQSRSVDSIKVNLLADGKATQSTTVTAATNWHYSFDNLPKYANGKQINYTITEDQVTDYNTEIKGYDITNTHTPGKTSVGVTKSWDDWYDQDGLRPASIKVQLYADGDATGAPVELNEGNNWHTVWNDLPENQSGLIVNRNGKTIRADEYKIRYTVIELSTPEGYQTETDDRDLGNIIITNRHTPETTKIEGQKTWADNNDQDGKRPASIQVNLLANGKVVDTREVTAADQWKYAFNDVPKYAGRQDGILARATGGGQPIDYTVTENQVLDYNTQIDGYNITNTYTPGKTSVSVTKAWTDKENQDGLRPALVHVQLYADGKESGAAVDLSEGNKWSHTWNDLPEKANGKALTYSVKETDTVEGYTAETNDSDLGNVIITNTHTTGTTQVEGQKTWKDNNDQDKKRPAKIKVNLLANGKPVDSKEVTAADEWKYAFDHLEKYEHGQMISYSVKEDQVSDYNTSYDGFDITNSYTPGKTSVSVTKAWDDKENQDNLRPKNIQVQLYANGEASGSPVTLSPANNWSTTWNELTEKEKGKAIVYTVKEITQTDGYTATTNESNLGNVVITNTHAPKPAAPSQLNSPPTAPTPTNNVSYPKTGEQRAIGLIVIGGILVLIAGWSVYKKVRENKQ